MKKHSTSHIGLDVHKESIAIAEAEPGRNPPRFVGTVTTVPSSLTKLHQNEVCIAIARELAGFIWDIGRQVDPPA